VKKQHLAWVACGLMAASGMALSVEAAKAESIVVTATNHSTPTTCAEEDNVSYSLSGTRVSGLSVSAQAPAYLNRVVKDYTAPDFSGCHKNSPKPKTLPGFEPPPMILYEDDQVILRGIIDPRFWRPAVATVKVDSVTWSSINLVQLFKKTPVGPIEFVVFYPQDGYWRLKGLPPMKFRDLSYGSSFLLGPIEVSTRPFVGYKSVTFNKRDLSFTIEFALGGAMVVTPSALDVGSAALDVRFDPPLDGSHPFAAIRSMYVAPDNNDTAEVAYRTQPGAESKMAPVMEFTEGQVADISFGRTTLSIHNISAPDMRFSDFR